MEKVFHSSLSVSSVMIECRRESGKVQGQKLEVIDTPGLFDTELSNEQLKAQISKCITYASPGPQVFLIILKAERVTEEEEETVKLLQMLFGEQAARYTMTLFTRGDDLEAEGVSIEDVIGNNKVLRAFLHQCKGGYHVFNNRNKDPAQVHELLKEINTMVERNGGRYFTNEMFQEAEGEVEEKKNELLKVDPQRDRDEVRSEAKEYVARFGFHTLALIVERVGAWLRESTEMRVGVGRVLEGAVGFVPKADKNKQKCLTQ
ncbi:GTPase IMAP family member 9 [Pleuronectes platessa]|uniref:GTPase IMAP family member 9 n=1 Tax=Pleuronectes platessa TaxID=8262 RepID=UPI00232A1068|nr:GTPase IMAP family member 9 [Pleuronectes platessa]